MDGPLVDLRSYWLALKSGWLIVLATLVVSVGAGLLLAWPSAATYSSTTRLFVAAGEDTGDITDLYQRNALVVTRLASYVELAESRSMRARVESASDADLTGASVGAETVPGTVVLTITALAPDAEQATALAAAYAEALPGAIEELEPVRDPDGPRIRAVVIDEASDPALPLPTTLRRDLIASVLLGLGVGLGLAVLRYSITRSDRGSSDVR